MPKPKSRREILATAAAALSIAPAGALDALASARGKSGTGGRQLLHPAIAFLDRLVAERRIPGGAVRIAQNGRVLLEHYAGSASIETGRPIAADTIYRAYSMTKPVTAAAVMMLVDEGKIRLSDFVEKFVPEFRNLTVYVSEANGVVRTEPSRPMRVVDLLAHTSGLSNSWNQSAVAPLYRAKSIVSVEYIHNPEFSGLPALAERLATVPLQFQPGTQWLYSIAPDIAGLIIERVSGMSFGEFLRTRIFDPLGMVDTGFYVPASKASRLADLYSPARDGLALVETGAESVFLRTPYVESGEAGLQTTLADYGRFASMLAARGMFGGMRLISERSMRTMMSSHVSPRVLGDSLKTFIPFGAGGVGGGGMGAALGGAVLVNPAQSAIPGVAGEYSWGGAASNTFFVVPDLGIDAVLMTQLIPSGSVPLSDLLKYAVYAALS